MARLSKPVHWKANTDNKNPTISDHKTISICQKSHQLSGKMKWALFLVLVCSSLVKGVQNEKSFEKKFEEMEKRVFDMMVR